VLPASAAVATRRQTVVAWPVSASRLTCVHPVPGPFRAAVLAVEAKSSITSPAMTGVGTRAENVV
jgi:hypothetical protein